MGRKHVIAIAIGVIAAVARASDWSENEKSVPEIVQEARDKTATPATPTSEGSAFKNGNIEWVEFPEKGFAISKTAVTVRQYRQCVKARKCEQPETGDKCNWNQKDKDTHPINCVRHNDAERFSEWLTNRLPKSKAAFVELPTIAEYRYAESSGGRKQKYPWGDEVPSCDRAVISNDHGPGCGTGRTWPVCSKPRGTSAQGICDLVGNVKTWVYEEDVRPGAGADGEPPMTYNYFVGGSFRSGLIPDPKSGSSISEYSEIITTGAGDEFDHGATWTGDIVSRYNSSTLGFFIVKKPK